MLSTIMNMTTSKTRNGSKKEVNSESIENIQSSVVEEKIDEVEEVFNHDELEFGHPLTMDVQTSNDIVFNDMIIEEEEEELKFDYRDWVDTLLQIRDGVVLFKHLFSLPPNRSTYGKVQVVNGVCKLLRGHKLKLGYDNHIKVMNGKVDKKGKFSIANLSKKQLDSFIDGMASHIDAMECTDLWTVLLQTIQSIIRDAIMQDKPLEKKVPIDTQRWAFVAHLMADTSLHGLFSEIQRGPERVEQHNEGGYQEWYLQKYSDILKAANVDSYINLWEEQSFKWTHPKTEETRTRTMPLKGIDPKVGIITEPKVLQQIRTTMMNDYDKLTTMMCASGNNEITKDRLMFYCTKGSCFQTKLFYVACVLMDTDTQFKSKRAYGISTGVTLQGEDKEGNDNNPHLISFSTTDEITNSNEKRRRTNKRKADSTPQGMSQQSSSLTGNNDNTFELEEQNFLRLESQKSTLEMKFKKCTWILKNPELFNEEQLELAKRFLLEDSLFLL